jgi:hypothetical protein
MTQVVIHWPLTAQSWVCTWVSSCGPRWHWDRCFSEFFGFPLSVLFHHVPILMYHRVGWTLGPLMAVVQRQSYPIDMNTTWTTYRSWRVQYWVYLHIHNTEWSKSHATHGVKGQSVGLVSLKWFITYKKYLKNNLQDFTVKVENDRHFLRSTYSHVSQCFVLLSLKFLGKYSIWQLQCFVLFFSSLRMIWVHNLLHITPKKVIYGC